MSFELTSIINNWFQLTVSGITIVVAASFLVKKINQVTVHDKALFTPEGSYRFMARIECVEHSNQCQHLVTLQLKNINDKMDGQQARLDDLIKVLRSIQEKDGVRSIDKVII